MLKDRNVLVIGGGFLGTQIARRLSQAGYFVTIFGRSWYHREADKTIEFVRADFLDIEHYSSLLQQQHMVIHCLSTTTPSSSNLNPTGDISTNLIPFVHLLESMKTLNIKNLIYLSSGGTIYGLNEQPSEQDDRRPICSYGIVKSAIENYIYMHARLHRLDYLILRLTNPFGPGQVAKKGQGVIAHFLKAAIQNDPIRIFGDGFSERDYIYVDDFGEIVRQLIDNNIWNKTLNVGSGQTPSLNEICDEIASLTKKDLVIVREKKRDFDLNKSTPKVDQLKSLLPEIKYTPFSQGLKLTYEHLQKNLD